MFGVAGLAKPIDSVVDAMAMFLSRRSNLDRRLGCLETRHFLWPAHRSRTCRMFRAIQLCGKEGTRHEIRHLHL
jgi:hypothetical protein